MHNVRFPKESSYDFDQNQAFFFLEEDGEERKIRFHDYDAIYDRPGLYEQLFYDRLQCASPQRVVDALANAVKEAEDRVETLRVLDLGAGNGIVGEELKRFNVARLVGADIIPEAEQAATRDRPGVYDDYLVADITALDAKQKQSLEDWRFSAMTTVAALGFDDIPAEAFLSAANIISDRGWIAFTIRTDFLSNEDASGFAQLIKALLYGDLVELHHLERYRHRLSIDGDPIFYFTIIARKRGPLSRDLLDG
ncbi:methyltransferase domain-containing protein [Parasphingopyxis algicola]|nr:methyltransferase domain-containing protein [Parasphingopyxis algicola]